jgi:hypothetical protein
MTSYAGALVDALRDALKADSGVAVLVGAKVYDEVPGDKRGMPDDATAPWVFIGPISGDRFEDVGYRAWNVRARIYAASTGFGRKEAWDVINAVDAALDGATLDLADGFSMQSQLRAAGSGDVVDPLTPKSAFQDFTCVIYRDEPFSGPIL